jgi:hypothetical protein
MILFHRYTRDVEYEIIYHEGIFLSIEQMMEFQKKSYLTQNAEDEKWLLAANPDYYPSSEFVAIDIVESKEWPGEMEVVTLCKDIKGDVFPEEQYLFSKIDTDKLENGGL